MTTGISVSFVADCGPGAGWGHLRRSLVLASAFKRRGHAVSMYLVDIACAPVAADYGIGAQAWPSSAPPTRADVVVSDGYRFGAAFPQEMKERFGRVSVVIDDLAEAPVTADVVINHNIYANELDYAAYPARTFLAGPCYALIDSEFFVRDAGLSRPPAVLIAFGSLDDGRYSFGLVEALMEHDDRVKLIVVAPNLSREYEQAFARLAGVSIGRLVVHRFAPMADCMQQATIFVGAAGVSVMEAMAAGLDLVVCATAANQRFNIQKLAALGYFAFPSYSPNEMIKSVSSLLREPRRDMPNLVEMCGPDRIVDVLQDFNRSAA
jgi:UDP-2,4-diacetamido-2,4,6-trideoxy-beta-L-altropyranose hydrolase